MAGCYELGQAYLALQKTHVNLFLEEFNQGCTHLGHIAMVTSLLVVFSIFFLFFLLSLSCHLITAALGPNQLYYYLAVL
jgi:uncharacterized membrane protein YqjE